MSSQNIRRASEKSGKSIGQAGWPASLPAWLVVAALSAGWLVCPFAFPNWFFKSGTDSPLLCWLGVGAVMLLGLLAALAKWLGGGP